MLQVDPAMLCVTEGSLQKTTNRHLAVSVPKMRAYFSRDSLQIIAAWFTYLGPTDSESPLGSGEMRRQFGFKLHSRDACNVVYAMWRIEPKSTVVVSVKSNPGQHTSDECGNQGYREIKPIRHTAVPLLKPGDKHRLRAELKGDQLNVSIDGVAVWEGILDKRALSSDGPVGIRSDNVRLEFELQVGRSPGNVPSYVLACRGPEIE